MQLDTRGLNELCACGSGKQAGYCCKQNELCSCGSAKKACQCCFKENKKDKTKKS